MCYSHSTRAVFRLMIMVPVHKHTVVHLPISGQWSTVKTIWGQQSGLMFLLKRKRTKRINLRQCLLRHRDAINGYTHWHTHMHIYRLYRCKFKQTQADVSALICTNMWVQTCTWTWINTCLFWVRKVKFILITRLILWLLMTCYDVYSSVQLLWESFSSSLSLSSSLY